jgi:uncharacterized protein (TIGR03083 family)
VRKASIDVDSVETISHAEAMKMQACELDRTLRLLDSLDDASWSAATACPAWDVRAMYQHVLGACEAGASVRENAKQLRAARSYRKLHGGPLEAALSGVQVRDRRDLSPAQVIDRLQAVAPRTVRGRTRLPRLLRDQVKLAVDGPVVESWTLGYLVDTIYLRDLWMHRLDAALAVGRPPELSADHDGRLVADVVVEWARRHGQPFTLELGGVAGGAYFRERGSAAAHVAIDAVEFCRTLAGRAPATGLLTEIVPF